MCQLPSSYPWNASDSLSGDQVGWRASSRSGEIFRASPPSIGTIQSAPSRSMAIHRPLGETAADIDVPSVRVTDTSRVAGGSWASSAAPADRATSRTERKDRKAAERSLY